MLTKRSQIGRREFVQGASAATLFSIVPRHVLGGEGNTPPSERLDLAFIGVGGQGTGLLSRFEDHNVVALCDVNDETAKRAYEMHPDAERYRDFRRLLDRETNIDGVVVATTDNLHAPVALAAMNRGKHVYCEKPLSQTVLEARKMAESAKANGVATQMGNSGQASEGARRVAEFINSGALGQVHTVEVWTDRPLGWWPQGMGRPEGTPAVPATLDWDLWLGPAPERDYHPAYLPFVWRGWRDFGTGALGDIGCHAFAPIFRALDLGHPTSVVASSTELNRESFPLASIVRYEFPERNGRGPIELNWYDGGLKPGPPHGADGPTRLDGNGTLYVGDKGSLLGGYGEPRFFPRDAKAEHPTPPKTLPRSPGHIAEWVEACKGGQAAGSEFQFASLVTEVVLLGNVALQIDDSTTGSKPQPMPKLLWDERQFRFTNHARANDFLDREYRGGWALE